MSKANPLKKARLSVALVLRLLAIAIAGLSAYLALLSSMFDLVGDGFGERCEQHMAGRSGPFEWSWDMTTAGVEVSCQDRSVGVAPRFVESYLWPLYLWEAVGQPVFLTVASYLLAAWLLGSIVRRLKAPRGEPPPYGGGSDQDASPIARRLWRHLSFKRSSSHLAGLLVATAVLTADHLVTMVNATFPYHRSLFVSLFGVPAAVVSGSLTVVILQRRAQPSSGEPLTR